MKPTIVLSNPRNQCATFCWPGDPRYYVGYRFCEYTPQTLPAPLAGIDEGPACAGHDWPEALAEPADAAPIRALNPDWSAGYREARPDDPLQLAFQAYAGGSAGCRWLDNRGAQARELYFQPAEDGVWLCLRLTGAQNEAWRRSVAHVPYLSELDLQAMGQANTTLTCVRRGGAWFNL